jgi:hypothetical protein
MEMVMALVTREQYLQALRQRIGEPYIWGISDCSQIVCDCLGIEHVPAQNLACIFSDREISRLQSPPGSLFFYGKDRVHITHVMSLLSHWTNGGMVLVGARGGDHTTISVDMAKTQKAFVDACFGDYWLDKFVLSVDPFRGI